MQRETYDTALVGSGVTCQECERIVSYDKSVSSEVVGGSVSGVWPCLQVSPIMITRRLVAKKTNAPRGSRFNLFPVAWPTSQQYCQIRVLYA